MISLENPQQNKQEKKVLIPDEIYTPEDLKNMRRELDGLVNIFNNINVSNEKDRIGKRIEELSRVLDIKIKRSYK